MCCTSEMDGMKDEEKVGNIDSEYKTVSSEYETEEQNNEDIEA